jgi:hypothetical protein
MDLSQQLPTNSRLAIDKRKSKSVNTNISGYLRQMKRLDTICEEESNLPFNDKKDWCVDEFLSGERVDCVDNSIN